MSASPILVNIEQVGGVHDCEARPLHPNLRDPQQTGKAGKALYLMTTRHVGSAGRQDHDVGEGACSGGGA